MCSILQINISEDYMIKKKCVIFVLFLIVSISFTFASERILIKNVSVFMPDGTWQNGAFISIDGCKIEKLGPMNSLKPGDTNERYDMEYDLNGSYVYPAFIDSYFQGLQPVTPPPPPRNFGRDQEPRRFYSEINNRKPFEERNYFICRKAINRLMLDVVKEKEIIGNGFAILHIVPRDGIIGGTSTVISLLSARVNESVLIPERFMALFIKPNFNDEYPTTIPALIADFCQLKEDAAFYQKEKKGTVSYPSKRMVYNPELEILSPYFKKEKRFIFGISGYTQQRAAEVLAARLDVTPVWLVHPEVWRRPVKENAEIILPLDFTVPLGSIYSNKGDQFKKESSEKLYPEKLAEFIKSHPNLSLSSPGENDYKKFYENLRILAGKGISEFQLVKALTENPARLLDIYGYAGSITPGKLASLAVWDKKFIEKDAKIKMMFVEGKAFDFKSTEKKDEKKDERKNKEKGDPR